MIWKKPNYTYPILLTLFCFFLLGYFRIGSWIVGWGLISLGCALGNHHTKIKSLRKKLKYVVHIQKNKRELPNNSHQLYFISNTR